MKKIEFYRAVQNAFATRDSRDTKLPFARRRAHFEPIRCVFLSQSFEMRSFY